MTLPHFLKDKLDAFARELPLNALKIASEDLSQRYKKQEKNDLIASTQHRQAYIVSRFPATYAVICRVLSELKNCLPNHIFESFLDIGTGPGTAAWAIWESLPEVKKGVLIDKDSQLMDLGKKMMIDSEMLQNLNLSWQQENLSENISWGTYDLVIGSYALGELQKNNIGMVVEKAWHAASKVAIFIEPGTPKGFSDILLIRKKLIELGAYLIAPCPHSNECPIKQGDWCHFSQRLERSQVHRQTKNASLSYEDEKYSYIIASKFKGETFPGRILRHPMKHTGHIQLTLCTEKGIEHPTVSKKHGEIYTLSRKLNWGDRFSLKSKDFS